MTKPEAVATPEAVLRFWFEDTPAEKRFGKDPAFDETIRRRFGETHAAAHAGALAHWQDRPESCLALVIVLDQFPRNMFRGDARAFASDPLARRIARRAVEQGWHEQMQPEQRKFLYLPFEHSEALADQDRCAELMWPVCDARSWCYVERHREIIRRFGRFPHRNAALGRESTPAELAFLAEPNSSF